MAHSIENAEGELTKNLISLTVSQLQLTFITTSSHCATIVFRSLAHVTGTMYPRSLQYSCVDLAVRGEQVKFHSLAPPLVGSLRVSAGSVHTDSRLSLCVSRLSSCVSRLYTLSVGSLYTLSVCFLYVSVGCLCTLLIGSLHESVGCVYCQ